MLQLLLSPYKLFILLKIPCKIWLRIVKMMQNVEYPTLPPIKMLDFWQHFWAENILKVPTKGEDIPESNLTPCKLSILSENTYEIWIKTAKRQKTKTRHVAVTDGVPCRLWDVDPWLTPVSLFIPQIFSKCMSYINILSNIKEVMHF